MLQQIYVRAALISSALILNFSNAASAFADEDLSAKLCNILKELAPQVKEGQPESAQMKLVMTTGGAFDFDGVKLREVTDKIDTLTSADCPKERDRLLAVLKTSTLKEALR